MIESSNRFIVCVAPAACKEKHVSIIWLRKREKGTMVLEKRNETERFISISFFVFAFVLATWIKASVVYLTFETTSTHFALPKM
jgi:hypothetical protein